MADNDTLKTAARLLRALDKNPDLKAEIRRALAADGESSFIICQDWEESERGWGVRPDGFTLHLTMEDRDAYVKGYNQTFNNEAEAPDEYTRTSGGARLVAVDAETYQALLEHHARDDHNHPFQKLGMWGKGRIGPKGYTP